MALDFRDQSTSGHSRRVANLTSGAASAIGIKDAALIQIEHGALLHDIGKLKIPDSILWKPAKLTDEEWQIMRRHAEYGFEFLSSIGFLKGAAEIVYSHHESMTERDILAVCNTTTFRSARAYLQSWIPLTR